MSQSKLKSALPWICTLIIILIGVALRCHYVKNTEVHVRGHDWHGHVNYIKFVEKNWTIPNADEEWESYHPPLYYFLNAAVLKVWTPNGNKDALDILQKVSLILSIATFLLMLLTGQLLFTKIPQRTLWGLTVATFPSIIFLSSRISNDLLLHFFVSLGLYLLVLWWKSQKPWHWYMLILVSSLAVLTKMNGLILLGPAGAALLFNKQIDFKTKKKVIPYCCNDIHYYDWMVFWNSSKFRVLNLETLALLLNSPLIKCLQTQHQIS